MDAGGLLVQQGRIDFLDLVWFVAIGSIVGGELAFRLGLAAGRGLKGRWQPDRSAAYRRAERLFRRRGGIALVIGRFLGPAASLVPVAAALAGMERRRFRIWNLASGLPYALAHVSLGYFLGAGLTRISPMATRIGLFVGALGLVAALLWWGLRRIERGLPVAVAVVRSAIANLGENPRLVAWTGRHPILAARLGARFDPSRFAGLPLTLIGVAFGIAFLFWAGLVVDVLGKDSIVATDARLANLLHAFWAPALLRAFAHVTALGDVRVVAALVAAALIWLGLLRRGDLALGLVVAVAANLVTVAFFKAAFDRPRSLLGYFNETSGSFPSGHAAVAVALYGMLGFIFWRLRILGPVTAALAASLMAFLVGLSRLYLIEHYLSDVLSGWLLGTLCLLVGIAVAEARRPAAGAGRPERRPERRRAGRWAGAGAIAILCMVALWTVATYSKARNLPVPSQQDRVASEIAPIFGARRLPVASETLTGDLLAPINVILLAPDEATLAEAMTGAGWLRSQSPGLVSLARAAWSDWVATAAADAPLAPFFWNRQPNDLAFADPAPPDAKGRRHHLRLWRTSYVTEAGQRIFVGVASLDEGQDFDDRHHIAPDSTAERARLVRALSASGAVVQSDTIRLPAPRDKATGGGSNQGNMVAVPVLWLR